MSGKNIFISYRRQDAAGEAGRLADSLKQYFNDDQIFMDVETIEPGVDFVEVITNAVSSCDVLLAVIGPRWLNISHPNGKRRLDDPDDFIRLEIAAALKRNIRVVPILVNDATMPAADQLPPELSSLVRRQAHEISSNRWKYDTEQLVTILEKILGVNVLNKQEEKDISNSAKIPEHHTFRPAQKSWLAKNYKWMAGIFIFLVLISMLIPEEEPILTYPEPDPIHINNDEPEEDDPSSKDSIKIAGQINPEPIDDYKDKPEATKTASYRDVNGVWFGMNLEGESFYFVIEQNKNNLNYLEYDLNDQQTGSGSGNINNNDIKLDYTSIEGVRANVQLKVSGDGEKLEGTVTEQSLGISIPISLSKFEL